LGTLSGRRAVERSEVIPRVESRLRSKRERLRQLAIVFKVAIRLKIVAELYIQAMSPKEFYEKFGGGSVERISQHFAELERHGWLRRLGHKERGTGRRGRRETLYRATQVAFFDDETWALLPYSLRLACSWSLFTAVAKELREGLECAVSTGCLDRDLTCLSLKLDSLGWTRVIAELGAYFESIFEEHEDAKIRAAGSEEKLVRLGILQIGFESTRVDNPLAFGLADGLPEPPIPFPERVAPILADDLSMAILATLNDRNMSVMQFHRELGCGASEPAVRYRFGRLKELSRITVVDKVKRRGAYENIYRATRPAIVENGPWADVPERPAEAETWAKFKRLTTLAKESIAAGTFDVRLDRHVCWAIVYLDRQGRDNVVASLNALEAFVREEERQAAKRIEAGAEPLTMVVALAALESPVGNVKAP
jgi:hypothetical protein